MLNSEMQSEFARLVSGAFLNIGQEISENDLKSCVIQAVILSSLHRESDIFASISPVVRSFVLLLL